MGIEQHACYFGHGRVVNRGETICHLVVNILKKIKINRRKHPKLRRQQSDGNERFQYSRGEFFLSFSNLHCMRRLFRKFSKRSILSIDSTGKETALLA